MTTKTINAAFDALRGVFYSHHYQYADQLLALCRDEEKSHRGFMPDFNKAHTLDTIGVTQAAKLCAVKGVAEYVSGAAIPKGRDYLHIQKSCFLAAGMADEFEDKIRAAWASFDIVELAALNYTDFVKIERREVVAA